MKNALRFEYSICTALFNLLFSLTMSQELGAASLRKMLKKRINKKEA